MIWGILILSYLSLFSMGFIDNARGPIYPLILEEYGITPSVGAWFFSLSSFGGILSTLSHRFWLPKFGPFNGIRFFILAMGIGCYGLGNVTGGDFNQLLLYSFIFGFGTGGLGICMNLLTPWAVPFLYRRRAFAGLHSTYALSSLIAPIILAYLLDQGIHWQKLFQYFFYMPAVLFLWSFTVKPPKQKYVQRKDKSINKWKMLFGAALGFYVSAEIVSSTRLVLYCTQYLNWTTADSSLYLSLFFLFLLIGRFSFATFHVKGDNLAWLITALVTSIVAFLCGLHIHPIGLSLTGLTMSFFFPCFIDWVSELFPEEGENLISSMLTSMGIMIVLMHNLVGYLNQYLGIQVAMHIGPLFCLISLLLVIRIKNVFNR